MGTSIRRYLIRTTRRRSQLSSSWETWPQEELPELPHSASCTLSISQELVSPLMLVQVRRENSLVSSTSLPPSPRRMDLSVSTEDSASQWQESSHTVPHTSECSIPPEPRFWKAR